VGVEEGHGNMTVYYIPMLRSPEKFELHPILRVAVLMPVYVKTPDD
jgi:hypothetical protein